MFDSLEYEIVMMFAPIVRLFTLPSNESGVISAKQLETAECNRDNRDRRTSVFPKLDTVRTERNSDNTPFDTFSMTRDERHITAVIYSVAMVIENGLVIAVRT